MVVSIIGVAISMLFHWNHVEIGLKVYSSKHSVGLAILFNLYQVNDKTCVEPLGKRRGKGCPKKVNTAYGK